MTTKASERAGWKAAERRIAELLGGLRVPVTGRSRGDVPDVDHGYYAIEVKHWARLPSRICEALLQAMASSFKTGRYPIAVLHAKGSDYLDSLVVMRLRDFKKVARCTGPEDE